MTKCLSRQGVPGLGAGSRVHLRRFPDWVLEAGCIYAAFQVPRLIIVTEEERLAFV